MLQQTVTLAHLPFHCLHTLRIKPKSLPLAWKGPYGPNGTCTSAICPTTSPLHTMFNHRAPQHVVLHYALGFCRYSFHCLESSSSTGFVQGYFLTVCLSLSDTSLGRFSLPIVSNVHYSSSRSCQYLLPSNMGPFLKCTFLVFCLYSQLKQKLDKISGCVFHVHQFTIKHIVDTNKVYVT